MAALPKIIPLSLSVLLFACGGGGGTTSTPTSPEPTTPTTPPPASTKESFPIVDLAGKLDQLQAFSIIANNIHFFHPSDGVKDTNWDAFLEYGMYRVASSEEDMATTLAELFAEVAPSVAFNKDNASYPLEQDDPVLAWERRGYYDDNYTGSSVYYRTPVTTTVEELWLNPKLTQEATTSFNVAGIDTFLPLVQKVENNQTLPASNAFALDPKWQLSMEWQNPYACMAKQAKVWSVVSNFFPYFSDIEIDWHSELKPMLSSCIHNESGQAIGQLFESLTKLQDNHATFISDTSLYGGYAPTVVFDFIENKPIAVYAGLSAGGIELGDELLAVEGEPTSMAIEALMSRSMRSDSKSKSEVLRRYLLQREEGGEVEVTIKKPEGSEQTLNLKTNTHAGRLYYVAADAFDFQNPSIHERLEQDNLHYINVSNVTTGSVGDIIQAVDGADGIILDFRSYPVDFSGWWQLFSRLSATPMQSLPMNIPFSNQPDHSDRYIQNIIQTIEPVAPTIDLPLVAIASRHSISQNEHGLGFLQSVNIPILGEPTYGINGNITRVILEGPEGIGDDTIMFTGMEVRQQNGDQFIGVGIVPDILVSRTITGIINSEDEQLKAAISYLTNNQ